MNVFFALKGSKLFIVMATRMDIVPAMLTLQGTDTPNKKFLYFKTSAFSATFEFRMHFQTNVRALKCGKNTIRIFSTAL